MLESYSAGRALKIDWRKVSIPFRSSERGPAQDRINFNPGVVQTRIPPLGTREAVGLNP